MHGFPDERADATDGREARRSPAALGHALLSNYPSLWRLFDGADALALAEMRERLSRTHRDLESEGRDGSPEEATGAGRASRAYSMALSLLDNLEEQCKVRGGIV